MIDDEGEFSTVDVQAKFVNGKPDRIEAKYIMRSAFEWDRFMRYMERYAEQQGLGFQKGHQRVCCHEEIKQAADMLEIVHAVSEPGYEPPQGKEWRHFCSSQLVMHFSISLYIGSILYAARTMVMCWALADDYA
ncbi:MAG: photosystem II reaction center Psb28 [Trebouxia sp. A1-2]|nr:MAG: photosystem II reaction center Psb28 [Trebouxia sp. A1-2]